MNKRYIITATSIFLFILIAIAIGRWIGETSAKNEVQTEMESAGAPTGFKGAKWLMDKKEVAQLIPDITINAKGNLTGIMEAYGRPARVTFWFQDGRLMMVIINYASISQNAFFETQRLLESQYGQFEEDQDKHVRGWTKSWPSLELKHNIRNINDSFIEQIQIYRSK